MRSDLVVGGRLPDLELPDHRRKCVKLSELAAGYPLIVSFYRGYWLPKCQCQLRHLTELQREPDVNYCHLPVISPDPPEVWRPIRAGPGPAVPLP